MFWQIIGGGLLGGIIGAGGFMALGAFVRGVFSREEEANYSDDTAFACPPPSLQQRLADCLADAVDTPLLTLSDLDGPVARKVELRLGSFNRLLSERAAALLEEAGR